jgi:hypothetical protein
LSQILASGQGVEVVQSKLGAGDAATTSDRGLVWEYAVGQPDAYLVPGLNFAVRFGIEGVQNPDVVQSSSYTSGRRSLGCGWK